MRSDEAIRAAGSAVSTGSELKMEHNKGSANNNSSNDNNTGNRPNFKGGSSNNNEVMKCPRCSSLNTKFCYYNNYSLTQPRYFCKSCRRYWTKGGTLRNVPVGGGCRKNKRVKLIRTSPSNHHPSSFPGLVGHDIIASAGFLNEHGVPPPPPPFLHAFSPSPFHENYPGLAFSDLQQSSRTPLSLMSQFVGIDGMDLYHPTSSATLSGSLDNEEAANLLNPRGSSGGAYPACKTDLSLFYEDSAVPQLQTSSALADYHMYTTRPPMSSSVTPTTANGSSPFHVIDSQLQMRHHKLTAQLMSEQRASENGSSSHMQPLGGCKEESLEDQLERFKAKALLSHLMNTTTNPLQLSSSSGGTEQQWQEEQEQVNNGMLPEAGWANSVWPDYHSLTSFAAGTMQ